MRSNSTTRTARRALRRFAAVDRQGVSVFADLGIKFPAASERVVVEKGREPRAQTVLSFFADPPIEESEQTRVAAAADVLEIALRDILREEMGETYNVSAGLSQALPQRGGGHISINFGASPENIDKMIERTLQEVARLQKEGPSEDLVTRAKETARREHETAPGRRWSDGLHQGVEAKEPLWRKTKRSRRLRFRIISACTKNSRA